MADMAIDKMTSSAHALINQQPAHVQDEAANVWITGTTTMADYMEVTVPELDLLDQKLNDFIRLEESWNVVKASVIHAATGLKGVFSLMEMSTEADNSPASSSNTASYGSQVFRRLSNALAGSLPAHSRASSVASLPTNLGRKMSEYPVYKTPNYVRNSVNSGCLAAMPNWDFGQHKLSAIPPTPAFEEQADPFDTSAAVENPPMSPLSALTIDRRAVGTATV